MPTTSFKNQTREDYWVQQYLPVYEQMKDERTVLFDDPEEKAKERAQMIVASEDELIWAYYKDPTTDVTQVEARDRAQSVTYPSKFQLSQSSISRKIKKLDKRMLTEPLHCLNMEQPDEQLDSQRVGLMARDTYEQYKRYRFIGFLDAWRSMLARLIVSKEALRRFSDWERKTPQWARKRFPNLDPNIGRARARRVGFDAELHKKQQKQVNAD